MGDQETTGVTGVPPASTEHMMPSATTQARGVAGTATAGAQSVAGAAADQAKSVAGTAAGQARVVAQDARGQARQLVHDARSQLRAQIGDQTSRLADTLSEVGHQLRTMSGKADDPESPVTQFTEQAATGVEQLASRLERGGLDHMVDDVKRFARNRPGVFLAGALGAGFVVGRLAKSADLGQVLKGEDGQGNESDAGPSSSDLGGSQSMDRTTDASETAAPAGLDDPGTTAYQGTETFPSAGTATGVEAEGPSTGMEASHDQPARVGHEHE
jgi:hypothetical protein